MAEEKKEVCRSCNFQKKCGGCQYQGMAYEEQLERKHRLVKRLIGPFCPVEPVAGMYYPYYYRNKVHRVFGLDKKVTRSTAFTSREPMTSFRSRIA